MLPAHDISQAIVYAVAHAYRSFHGQPDTPPPSLQQCRYSLYMALTGLFPAGKTMVAEVRQRDRPPGSGLSYLDDNAIWMIQGHLFNERGEVSERQLIVDSEKFSQVKPDAGAWVEYMDPAGNLFEENIRPDFVAVYRKFLGVALQHGALDRQTPAATPAPRPRL